MKKASKRITITSEAKNSLGFHVATSGIELGEFRNNPLLLWMHKRPKGEKDELLPLGYWDELELKDGKISGIPVFDDTDDFAMKIYQKVENGTLRMASAGLKPVTFGERKGAKWLEKSVLVEASIVDIGSNKEALAVALYNDDNELVTLADALKTITKPNFKTMDRLQLSEPTLALLKLKDGATEADAHVAIMNLVTLSQTQANEISTLKDNAKTLQDKLDAQAKETAEAAHIALVDKAVTDRKITADQKPHIVKLFEADAASAKSYLDSLPANPTVSDSIKTEGGAGELVTFSWDQLDKANKLVKLKEADFEAFKSKYKEKYGKPYKES